ncbi:sigma-54-dependent transcriptional regulator [Vulgatibacter incomptus]|uniref:Two component, sigma54 specific, transcriptional regulator, Fis family n=1 Tax=Vulgatibacter incomptus TaxID=1391653 RepID=A0A0K1PFY0_9BACT|nr:sigma-54 dependent transcriptional regulator [Vulgatibacter incomptus]AKU92321.1 two component, sigma54 specific, transcriptional regulator, Fis family [Vulgatibacter incomptus]
MAAHRILAVDDDAVALEAVVELLRGEGHVVDGASSPAEADELLRTERYNLVITDLVMPGRSGIELTRSVRETLPDAAVLVVTGHATAQSAIAALKAGALDYLTKPLEPGLLRSVVSTALHDRAAMANGFRPARSATAHSGHDGLLSRAPAMHAVFERIALAASSDATVLIRGESGSGKESCARAIHKRSSRSEAPFLPLHVAAISHERLAAELFGGGSGQSKFQQAEGGTIFLDEVDALDPRSQLVLYRFLESGNLASADGSSERKADVRVIAATGRDLGELVRLGRFREDLFYRLDVFPLTLPPLRDRKEDIPLLVSSFIETFSDRYRKPVVTATDETLSLLARYPWPGNVRELRNVVEHAVILCTGTLLTPDFLPRVIYRDEGDLAAIRIPIGTPMREIERAVIARTLDAYGWNKNKTAKVLGISRRSLYNKLERYRIARGHAAPLDAAAESGPFDRPAPRSAEPRHLVQPPAAAEAER